MQSKFCSARITLTHFFLSPNAASQYWLLVEFNNGERILHSHLREMRSLCLLLSRRQSFLRGWYSRLLIICLSWVASKGKMFLLWKDSDHKSNGSQLEQTALPGPQPMSFTVIGWRQSWVTFSVSYPENWKFDSKAKFKFSCTQDLTLQKWILKLSKADIIGKSYIGYLGTSSSNSCDGG